MDLIETLLDLEVPSGVQLSPDGEFIVYSTGLKWGYQKGEFPASPIWLARTGEEKSTRKIASGYNDRMPKWAPDSKSIGFISDRGKQGKANALHLLTIGSDQPRALTPAQDEARISNFIFSPDGRHIAFASTPAKSADRKAEEESKDDARVWGEHWQFASLHLVEIESGSIRNLFQKDLHVKEFAWSEDGSQITVTTSLTPHIESDHVNGIDLFLVDIESGRIEKLCNVPRGLRNLVWAGSCVYFIANYNLGDDESGSAVYSIDPKKTNPAPEKVAFGKDDCPSKLAKIGNDVVALVQKGMDDCLQIVNGEPLVTYKNSIIDYHGGHRDSKAVLVTVHGDTNRPSEVFVTTDGKTTRLSDHGKSFEDKKFGAVTFIECQTFDGKETLEGMFITPVHLVGSGGKPTRPVPTYVSVHGGPYFRLTDSFDGWDFSCLVHRSLLAQGYGLLVPNYRGSSGRGSRFASYTKGGMGLYDEPDIVAMSQYAIEQGFADKNRLVIGGWSQGGYLSYLSSVRNGKHGLGWSFKGVIAGAGVTDWDTMTLTSDLGYMEAGMAGGEMWNLEKGDVRTRSGSALWEFRDAVREGRIPPLLMLHGERDERVPIGQAWGFRRALVKAGLPFEFVTYPREGHFFRERKHIADLIRRTLRFVEAQLS